MTQVNHVAIIMDGNGRWALKNKKPRNYGHYIGTKNILPVVKNCIKKKIKYLSLYAFSKDNWKRPKKETVYLFHLLKNFINDNFDNFIKENIKIKFIGDTNNLTPDIKKIIKKIEINTNKNNLITVIVALNYSGRHEITRSINEYLTLNKKIKKISPKEFEKYLFTKNVPDPQILIRTGGYKRLSDFLLWQMAYTEFFFLKKMWPDFNTTDLNSIIKKFCKIKRNFGSL